MKPPTPQARLLLERYRAGTSLGADAKARLGDVIRERALRGDLPRFDVQPLPSSAPLGSVAGRVWSSGLAKLGLGLALAGAVSGVAYQVAGPAAPSAAGKPVPSEAYVSHARAPSALVQPAPAPLPGAEPVEPATTPNEAPRKAERSPAHAPAPAAEPTVDDEVKLMTAAQAALRAGDAKRALTLTNEHAARFPSGKLATARKVTRMVALCQAGSAQQARREAAEFLDKNPGSPFAERVRGICASPK